MSSIKEFFFTRILSEASTESFLRLIDLILAGEKRIRLNWSEVEEVDPAGIALLSLVYDLACERKIKLDSVFTKKKIKDCPIVSKFQEVRGDKLDHSGELCFSYEGGQYFCLENAHPKELKAVGRDPFEQADIAHLFRELTQNAIEHSSSERFYAYTAETEDEIRLGVLDVGVGIPAKLKNHFSHPEDLDFIESALEKGSTSRRLKEGGIGLYRVSQMVKQMKGRLVILSGEGQLRRYYANRRIDRKSTKFRTPGTWIFISIPKKK